MSKEMGFIDQEHDKLSQTVVLDFSGCKGAYLLPYEFCVKEIDEHHVQEIIAEQSSVDIEHQCNGVRDPKKEEDKTLESHIEAGQDIVQVMQPSCSPKVIKKVYPTNNLLVFRFGHILLMHLLARLS